MRRFSIWFLFACFWLTLAAADAQRSLVVNDLDAGLRGRIDATAEQALEQTGVPSASIAVVQHGRIVYTHAYGKAKLDPPVAAEPAMRYSIGSISKQRYLNKPWYGAYWHFLSQLAHGNLVYDYYNNVPVTTSIKQALPITLSLVIGASIIWLAIGLATGILSAVRTRSVLDRFFTTQALFFYSMPTFVLGLRPARAHNSWKHAFGRAPPPRKTGPSGVAFSGRMLLRCACTT